MKLSEISSVELGRLCADARDTEAWREFVRRFRRPIALTALRVTRMWGARGTEMIDDLIQETFLRLCSDKCKLLRTFTARSDGGDALAAFIKVIASNVTHDHFRGRSAAKRGGPIRAGAPELPDEELLSDLWSGAQEVEREVRLREIQRTLEDRNALGITDRDRIIFRLYFLQGLTAAGIAAIPAMQLTIKGVESAVHRVTQYLRLRLNPEGVPPDGTLATRKGSSGQIPLRGAGG